MSKSSKKILNILVVEDNIGDARLISELLKEIDIGDHDLTYITVPDEIAHIGRIKFDIILLDLHLSDMTPIETYQTFNEAYPRTPIVVLTGLADDELASKIVRLGAQDYLIKGTFDALTLRRSIKYAIERKKSQLQLAREQSKSRQLRIHSVALEDETKRLEAINKAKDIFLSIASHQLRTPATAVKQYLGMLLDGYGGEMNEDLSFYIKTAYESNERQLKIVDDLLKIARLDTGHYTLHTEPTDLNTLIKRVVEDQSQSFAKKSQTVVFTPLDQPAIVEVDQNSMHMVFENILDNAQKYSGSKTTIKISVQRGKDELVVACKDQGIGISRDDRTKLFQKFSRIGNSFKYSPNGSGLGLYWVKEIMKLHKGSVSLTSIKGKGSTFTIHIPWPGQGAPNSSNVQASTFSKVAG